MDDKDESLEPRQRKKKLINEVKEILEFYFSPCNVSKDKFMRNLLEENDYVDLEIFFKFNKIKRLTNNSKIIKKAVQKSEILELSEDESKIKRKIPLEFKEDEMECTIYVENLPPNSSHAWLQKVFSLYGTIDYISLPKFQQSGRPKGFAFIEFSCPQEAQKALEAFGGLASLDGTLNPSDLLTIKTYGQLEDKLIERDTSSPPVVQIAFNQDIKNCSSVISTVQATTDQESKKRSLATAFENEDAETGEPAKKSKLEIKENELKKKKKRKRNKKEKEYELHSVYLRVMSKRDWKSLRNKYLNIQRENMKQLKQQIIYQNIESENINVKSNHPKFISDVIVKLTLDEPPQDPTAFRQGLTSGRTSIAYVDINAQETEVYVRFLNSDGAKEFVKEGVWKRVELLTGEAEEKYWDKLVDCWNQKRHSKKCAPRGREKLINKALKQKDEPRNSYIVFED